MLFDPTYDMKYEYRHESLYEQTIVINHYACFRHVIFAKYVLCNFSSSFEAILPLQKPSSVHSERSLSRLSQNDIVNSTHDIPAGGFIQT